MSSKAFSIAYRPSRSLESETFIGEEAKRNYIANRTSGRIEDGSRLCNAISHMSTTAGDQRSTTWVTPILGSGCLDARDTAQRPVEHLPAVLGEAIRGAEGLYTTSVGFDTDEAAHLVEAFAASLVKDRLGLPPRSPSALAAEDRDNVTAMFVLAAALAARLFHSIRSLDGQAAHRAGDEEARLVGGTHKAVEIEDETLAPLIATLRQVEADVTKMPFAERRFFKEALAGLAHQLQRDVLSNDGPWLTLGQVQLLSELAWYHMTSGTAVYPGWGDLLLRLSMQEDPKTRPDRRRRPRITDITQPPAWIEERLSQVTARSWETAHDPDSESSRDGFYSSVAHLLAAQASARRPPGGRRSPLRPAKSNAKSPVANQAITAQSHTEYPLASGFVTSFDLELEMALWMLPEAGPFVLAVPVNVLGADLLGRVRCSPQPLIKTRRSAREAASAVRVVRFDGE